MAQVDCLTVDQDLVVVQHLGQHGRLGELAREARRPVLARLVELRLPSGATRNLSSRVPARLGEVLEKPREAEPVVGVAVGDVDTRDLLAEGLRPGGDLVRVLEGSRASMRIPSVGPEINVLLDGAQVATSPSPS